MSQSNTALAIVPTPSAALALEPTDLDSAYKVAQLLSASRMLGAASRTPESTLAVIMTGRELGLTALQSLRSINFENGKPILAAELMVALVRRSPLCRSWRLVESTNTVARYETHRAGDEKPTPMAYTIEQAKNANLLGKTNWKHHPDAMLRARASAALCRAVYPDLLMGFYDPDEMAPGEQRVPEVRREPEVTLEDLGPIVSAQELITAQNDDDKSTFAEELAAKLEACVDRAAVADLSPWAKRESRRLRLTREEHQKVADAFGARREELAALAAPAPEPSSERTVEPATEVA